MKSSTLGRPPKWEPICSSISISQSLMGKWWSCNQTAVKLSFSKASLKYSWHSVNRRTIPEMVQGPFYSNLDCMSTNSHWMKKSSLSISATLKVPKLFHISHRATLTCSSKNTFPRNFPNKAACKWAKEETPCSKRWFRRHTFEAYERPPFELGVITGLV